ncbi:serine/threonine-protein kinase [Actinoplanes utahensis]
MSVVWRADDDVLGREVAVKVLSPRLATDPEVTHRILAEARAAAGLRHSMVVEVYDYGEAAYHGKALPYVVMELVDGRTLADLLSGNRIPWRLAVLICAQVAAALAAAHARGVVHRDVKPGNVMVSSSGVKLVDFGISAAVGEMDGADGQLLGTPAYLAPERIDGGPVRPATDVYALGLLLYLSLAGRMPWRTSTVTQQLRAHYYTEPAPLPPVPGLPSEVSRLVPRCLAKAPEERPSAAEVAEVLGRIAGLPPAMMLREAAASAETSTVLPRLRDRATTVATAGAARVIGDRRVLAAAGAACVLAVAGLVTWDGGDARTPSPAAAGPPPGSCATAPSFAASRGIGCRSAPAAPSAPATGPAVTRPPASPPGRLVTAAGSAPKAAASKAAATAAPASKAGGSEPKAEKKTKAKAKTKDKNTSKTGGKKS